MTFKPDWVCASEIVIVVFSEDNCKEKEMTREHMERLPYEVEEITEYKDNKRTYITTWRKREDN